MSSERGLPPERRLNPNVAAASSRWSALRLRILFLLLLFLASANLRAAESGESVVVVYNDRVPGSKQVAEHYAKARHVPAGQVVGFKLPKEEAMTRQEFSEQLQLPLFRLLEKEKLFTLGKSTDAAKPGRRVTAAKIRYAVLCYGVPVKILRDAKLVEPGEDKLPPEMRRNEAAVDSELALLPMFEQKLPLHGPVRNVFYNSTNGWALHPTNGILLVARLDGPTAKIAQELVDKAMAAEADGLWGRAYFDARGLTDGPYKLGDDWIRGAAQAVKRFGFETVLDEKPEVFSAAFPMSQIALYAGWYEAGVTGPFTRPAVEFMPGAIAYHLHSFSAATLRTETGNWVGPLLAKGATATLGCVDEPYLVGTPDLAVFFKALLFSTCSFGEAAYLSQTSLSWQTTVIGDPLYRPFLKAGRELHQELQQRKSPLLAWSHLRVVNLNLETGIKAPEMIGYLMREPLAKTSAVLSEKLGDLLVAENRTADAVDAYMRALRNEATPQQQIRLLLKLAEKQAALDRNGQALETYQVFLKNFTDYPDLLGIYQQAVAVAEKAKQPDVAEQLKREVKRLSGGK